MMEQREKTPLLADNMRDCRFRVAIVVPPLGETSVKEVEVILSVKNSEWKGSLSSKKKKKRQRLSNRIDFLL